MYKGLSLSLVIPCYNEEGGIKSILENAPKFVDEVIVVDNNCTDRTAEIAVNMGGKVVLEKKQGYGVACKRGFSVALGDIIIILDGDGMYPIEALLYLVEVLERERLDFITVGRRPDSPRSPMSRLRYIGCIILNLFIYLLFDIKLLDSQSGMWVFRRHILNNLCFDSDGMSFSEEMKIEVFTNKGFRAKEIMQRYYEKRIGKSKLKLFHDGFGNFLFLFKKKFFMKWKYHSLSR